MTASDPFQFESVVPFVPALAAGLAESVWITAVAAALGSGIVAALYALRLVGGGRFRHVIDLLSIGYIDLIQSIPVLVGLVWLYYGAPEFGIRFPADFTAELVLGISFSAFLYDLLRAAELSVTPAQVFAARIHGASSIAIIMRVYTPIMARAAADPLAGQLVSLLKLSTFAYIIGSNEILSRANQVIATTYRPMEVYALVAVGFVVLIVPVNLLRRGFASTAWKVDRHT